MAVELKQLVESFDRLWPATGAEDWDNPGLVCGDLKQRVSRVLLSVDVTTDIISEAIDGGFDLLLAHHPYLLRGITSLREDTAKGMNLASAIRADLSIFAAHTNADIVESGVSHAFANALGLQNVEPLVPSSDRSIGHGRIGVLSEPIALGEFARHIAKVLPSTATGVRVAGDFNQLVQRVALCGGAGDSFIPAAMEAAVDVYVTSDLRHHPVQDAREHSALSGGTPAIIDVSHWASEWLWLDIAAEQLGVLFPNVQFVVSQLRTDPWDFVVTQ